MDRTLMPESTYFNLLTGLLTDGKEYKRGNLRYTVRCETVGIVYDDESGEVIFKGSEEDARSIMENLSAKSYHKELD